MTAEASEERALGKIKIEFEPEDQIELQLLLVGESPTTLDKGCIIAAQFAEADGTIIDPPYEGWHTGEDGRPFIYALVERAGSLDAEDGSIETASLQHRRPQTPPQARSAIFFLERWRSTGDIAVCEFAARAIAAGRKADNDDDKPVHEEALLHKETLRCAPSASLLIEFDLVDQGEGDTKGAILVCAFLDENGDEIQGPFEGLFRSGKGFYYKYINTSSLYSAENGSIRRSLFFVPENTVWIRLELRNWADKHRFTVKSGFQIRDVRGSALIDLVRKLVVQPNSLEIRNLLERILDHVRGRGQIEAERSLLRLVTGTALDQRARKRLPVVEGALREMRTDWLPLPSGEFTRGEPLGPERRVLSLVKVCRPYENTGGAVRNEKIFGVLKTLGWDQYALTPLGYPGRLEDGSTPYRTEVEGVPHMHLNIADAEFGLSRSDHLLRYETALFASIYRKIGGRIVHAVSGYRGYESALKALALKTMFGTPVLYDFRSFHEHTWSPFSPHVFDAQQTVLRAAQEDRCVREADHCVVISRAMKSILIERGADPDKISVIPNGVDVSRFIHHRAAVIALRYELGIPQNARVHGYISNFSVREGHIHLLRAHKLILEKYPNTRCLLVGGGPRSAYLKKLAGELGIADSVIFTGEIPHEKIAPYYAIYDVFVVTRINDYASDYVTPLKPFEAMAAGVPLVMSDLPVTTEIIGRSGERGLTAIPGSPEDIARAIRRLFFDPALARRIGEAGRDWVSRERNWDTLIRGYSNIYDMLINAVPRSRA